MRGNTDLARVDLAGWARRWKETVSSIKLTGSVANAPERAVQRFLSFPTITSVEKQSNASASVRLIDGLRVSFSTAAPNEYWNLLHFETGSTAHIRHLSEIARTKGIELTPTKLTVAARR